MIVVDTSVWIDFFRGTQTPQVDLLVAAIERDDPIALTDIVLTEILQGLRTQRDVDRVESALLPFPILQLGGLDDFRRAAALYRTARRRGVTIRRTLDCLIASVCIREGVALLHADGDFDRLAACTALTVVDVSQR